mgnify:CR=1 FL=1
MNFLKYSKFYYLISLLIIIPGLIFMLLGGLKFGIDFVGGTDFTFVVTDSELFSKDALEEYFQSKEISVIEKYEAEDKFIITTEFLTSNALVEIKKELTEAPNSKGVSLETYESIGPSIGKETRNKALIAMIVASTFIVLYIAYSFRNVPSPYSSLKFGVSAIIAMLHDVLGIIGIFAILGYFYGIKIDSLFITAMLTITGFSVHDTIVVFDRIRENLLKMHKNSFEEVVNFSIIETVNRSIATSLSVITVLFSMFFLGGETIKYFILALLLGLILGTYSSIFIASPILYHWEMFSQKIKKNKK